MQILFWVLFSVVLWCYVAYPAVMRIRAAVAARPVRTVTDGAEPRVSIVLAVRNGAGCLAARLQNLLDSDYPPAALEILVVCNGCSDGSEGVARRIGDGDRRIKVLVSPTDEGKAGALNAGAATASGSVLVFADVRQEFDPLAVRLLVAALRDPEVGAVSGRLVIGRSDQPAVAGMRWYWGIESALRIAESRTGSVVGATGAIYAIRRELYEPLPPNLILDDVYLPLRIVRKGYRVVLAPEAVAVDRPMRNPRLEYERKRRTMVGNFELLRREPWVLVPWRNPLFVRFVSHKVLRLVSPVCFLGMLVLGALLPGDFYRGIATAELILYLLGGIGLFAPVPALSVPAAFLLIHLAIFEAAWRSQQNAARVWRVSPAHPDESGLTRSVVRPER